MTLQERHSMYMQQFSQTDARVKQLEEELEITKALREQLRGKFMLMDEMLKDEQQKEAKDESGVNRASLTDTER